MHSHFWWRQARPDGFGLGDPKIEKRGELSTFSLDLKSPKPSKTERSFITLGVSAPYRAHAHSEGLVSGFRPARGQKRPKRQKIKVSRVYAKAGPYTSPTLSHAPTIPIFFFVPPPPPPPFGPHTHGQAQLPGPIHRCTPSAGLALALATLGRTALTSFSRPTGVRGHDGRAGGGGVTGARPKIFLAHRPWQGPLSRPARVQGGRHISHAPEPGYAVTQGESAREPQHPLCPCTPTDPP